MSNTPTDVTGPEHDDYLWNGRGAAPADVARLEALLREYRYDPARGRGATTVVRRVGARRWMALAATIALAVAAAVYFMRPPAGAWDIEEVQGSPTIAGAPIHADTKFGVGEWLQTDAASSAVVDVAGRGHVTVQPGSRVRLVGTGELQHRMELAQGSIEAFIIAPPKLFFVDTPSAVAVDYGCMYTLEVQPDGSTLLKVTLGLVKLVSNDTESAVPRGLVCRSVKGRGPGTPYDPGADTRFIGAIAEMDAQTAVPDDALRTALAFARPRDRLTLWHLLRRVSDPQRTAVYDALAKMGPLPAGTTPEAIMRLDPAALDAWWQELYLNF